MVVLLLLPGTSFCLLLLVLIAGRKFSLIAPHEGPGNCVLGFSSLVSLGTVEVIVGLLKRLLTLFECHVEVLL